jgi:hypothetical protein
VYSSSLSFSFYLDRGPPATKEGDLLEHTVATEELERDSFIGE